MSKSLLQKCLKKSNGMHQNNQRKINFSETYRFWSNVEMENVQLKCSYWSKCDWKVAEKIKRARQIKLCEPWINKTDVCKLNFEKFHPLISRTFENQFDWYVCKSENLFLLIFWALCEMKCMLWCVYYADVKMNVLIYWMRVKIGVWHLWFIGIYLTVCQLRWWQDCRITRQYMQIIMQWQCLLKIHMWRQGLLLATLV